MLCGTEERCKLVCCERTCPAPLDVTALMHCHLNRIEDGVQWGVYLTQNFFDEDHLYILLTYMIRRST